MGDAQDAALSRSASSRGPIGDRKQARLQPPASFGALSERQGTGPSMRYLMLMWADADAASGERR